MATAAAMPPETGLPSVPTRTAGNRGDLLAPLLPSMEDGRLHAAVSGLRVALQQTQQTLGYTQQQVIVTLGDSGRPQKQIPTCWALLVLDDPLGILAHVCAGSPCLTCFKMLHGTLWGCQDLCVLPAGGGSAEVRRRSPV